MSTTLSPHLRSTAQMQGAVTDLSELIDELLLEATDDTEPRDRFIAGLRTTIDAYQAELDRRAIHGVPPLTPTRALKIADYASRVGSFRATFSPQNLTIYWGSVFMGTIPNRFGPGRDRYGNELATVDDLWATFDRYINDDLAVRETGSVR